MYKSLVQQSVFNCLYQIGQVSLLLMKPDTLAEEMEVVVEYGDVVILGTDGLFDNMFDAEIERVVQTGLREGGERNTLARTLAMVAR